MIAARLVVPGLVLLLAACSASPRPHEPRRPVTANPSALVAVELSFARAAQDRGQWTAFRRYAAKQAEMFMPRRVAAQAWLAKRPDPAQPIGWTPASVLISCDGSVGATTGSWTGPGGAVGFFTRVWERQRDGSYKWVLDSSDLLASARPTPDFVDSHVASCTGRPGATLDAPAPGDDSKVGLSRDQTLQWRSTVHPDGSRDLVVSLWDGTGLKPRISDHVGPPVE